MSSTTTIAPAAPTPAREPEPQPAAAPTPPAETRGKRPVLPLIITAALLLLAFFGYRWWTGRAWETTDNAQVEGHITPVLPKASGFVARVLVEENQAVRGGQVLVQLDDREYRDRLRQAEAELSALQAQVGASGQAAAQAAAARATAEAARSAIAQAEANALRARRDLERLRPLAERAIISRQQLDAGVAVAAAADAQVAAARENAAAAGSQATATGAGVRTAEARLEAARAARDQAALQLSYTRVLAPADGIVTKRAVETGQLVQVGQPLMTVVPLDNVWVTANLKETQVRDVRAGEPVEFEVDAYPGTVFRGRVESVSPATGAKFSLLPPDNATGNYTKVVQRIPVRIRVESRDPARPLRPGMSAVARIRAR